MISSLVKCYCSHCETWREFHRKTTLVAASGKSLSESLIPAEIICWECGRTLYGHRRVSRADGKSVVWIEYTSQRRD
jgi:hypothetical protein